MKSRFRTNGSFFELLDEMKKMEPGRLKELIVRYFQYKEGDLFVNDSVDHPEEINFSMEFNKLFDFKSGPNFFFPSSILKINAENLHSENNRSIEYVFHFPYQKTDTTIFRLPPGFTLESPLKTKELANKYVHYNRVVNATENTITIITNLTLKESIIPASGYNDVTDAFAQIKKEEDLKLILQKK